MNTRKKTKRNRRASLATFVATYSDNNLEDGAAKKETIKTSAAEDRNKFAIQNLIKLSTFNAIEISKARHTYRSKKNYHFHIIHR